MEMVDKPIAGIIHRGEDSERVKPPIKLGLYILISFLWTNFSIIIERNFLDMAVVDTESQAPLLHNDEFYHEMGMKHELPSIDQRPQHRYLSPLRRAMKAAFLCLAVVMLSIGLVKVGLLFSGYQLRFSLVKSHAGESPPCTNCQIYEPAAGVKAPNSNVWAPITAEDNLQVWNLLHDPALGLNLTAPEKAGINDNAVFIIDTLPLNKSDVIAFLDHGGPKPRPYARVMIHEGGKPEPVAQEYMVGPLPVTGETRVDKLDYIYNGDMGGSLPYNARSNDPARMLAGDAFLAAAMQPVADIVSTLFPGAAFFGTGDERSTLAHSAGTPLTFDGTEAFVNIGFNFKGPALYIIPIDFYILIDWSGTDMTLWKVKGYVTKERFFPSEKELRQAFEAGDLEPDLQQHRDYDWALVKYQPELGERRLEGRAAPENLEVGGKRYELDADEKYVQYMGWSFYITYTRSLGPMFYDIRFNGERILYELSLQEAAAQYGGFQPKSASTMYHDTSFGFGGNAYPLVEGFDCPFGSTFWNMSFFDKNKTVTHGNSICIFEHDSGHPLSRHRAGDMGRSDPSGFGFENLGVVKASVLSIRSISTLGNYDYIVTHDFNQDGSIGITVRASGYLMGSYYYKNQQGSFGPRLQKATQGSIHDHVITFKADFDILDSANSLEKTELKAVEQEQPWFPELGTFEQLQLEKSVMEKEQQFNWGQNGEAMYSVVHKNATNKWGERRGYRIIGGLSNIHLTTKKSPFSKQNSEYMKSHLAVTRQHDTEPFANSIHNANLPSRPQVDFMKYFDNETVDGEDLVIYFNLGMHHFTRAEDIPVTLFSEAVSSITLAPQNFFDRAQDGDLKNRRWFVPNNLTGTLDAEAYGVTLPRCKIDLREPAVARIE